MFFVLFYCESNNHLNAERKKSLRKGEVRDTEEIPQREERPSSVRLLRECGKLETAKAISKNTEQSGDRRWDTSCRTGCEVPAQREGDGSQEAEQFTERTVDRHRLLTCPWRAGVL